MYEEIKYKIDSLICMYQKRARYNLLPTADLIVELY